MKCLSLFVMKMLVLVAIGGFIANSAIAAESKLVIAVQPTSTPEQLSTQSKEIKAVLEQQLGQEVELIFPSSYAGVIEALRFGHAQVAFMGSWPALLAITKADAKILLAEVRDVFIDDKKAEEPYYFSYWVVKEDSPYNSLEELKGHKAAFPSQLSSSGYIAPLSKLVELGFVNNKPADPKEYFSEVLYSGGYAQGWEALKQGQVDVTVIAGDVPETLYKDVLSNSKIVAQQGPIPSHAIVVASSVSAELREKIKNAFLEFNKEEYKPLMRKFVSGIFVRFIEADESHLASLKKMVELTGIEFTEKK